MIDKIMGIISEIRPYEQISVDSELTDSGILDSLAIFNLITLLEDEFDIEIEEDEINKQNFSSVASIAKIIENKRRC